MASITVKNIPDDLYEHLKKAASEHRRSINSELIVCLEKVLSPSKISPADFKEGARALRKRVPVNNLAVEDIDAAKQDGRP